jgi:hypothetical protein
LDEVKETPFILEADLSFGGVNIDIDHCGIASDVEDHERIPTGGEQSPVGAFDRSQKAAVLDPPSVHHDHHGLTGLTRELGRANDPGHLHGPIGEAYVQQSRRSLFSEDG